MQHRILFLLPLALAALFAAAPLHAAPEDVVATVNGIKITEGDLEAAQSEVGRELAQVPEESRRPILVNFLIETHLMSQAAEKEKLAEGADFAAKMEYYKRRALRETYIEKTIREQISEAVARKIYDDQIKSMKPQDEISARHVLVATEDEAKAVITRIEKGDNFAAVAKELSLDKSTDGGSLGYFPRGRMVKVFEDAAFALQKGEVSKPVKSQFGWHVIKLEDRRQGELPKFEEVKDRIMGSLLQQKAQETVAMLKKAAKIDILDPGVKKAMDEAEKRQADQMQQMQQMQQRQKQPQGAPSDAAPPPPVE